MNLLPFRRRSSVAVYAPEVLQIRQKPLPALTTCIALDLIGCVGTIPIIGFLLGLVWAPISAMIYWRLFGFRKGFFGGWFSLVEELIPGINLIPTFTITWAIQFARRNNLIPQSFMR